ncbi:helix-turn-helix transcriptional regulator [Clostridiales Family XIII bacterium ASD5510]|uniref:Helix-turn-helix transcriptional regulator n=2 Tax=Hominibacterium faecale TaxID=2839743 RepID=A0A9J6QZV3_9FIRM|nr:helix-turn-helix transcriptional regulator [Hominibacterium faecale]MCU7381016.1 helix-turn-helix transcriptional regulator [Hominibacterium faecale]
MVKCKLSLLMGRDRKKIQDVCNETGLARNTVANLYNDKAGRIDFTTIDKLCEMFQCTVGELLEYEQRQI